MDRTRASPTPRPSVPAGLVLKPCSKTRSRSSARDAIAAVAEREHDRTRRGAAPCPLRIHRGSGPTAAASIPLSMRLPTRETASTATSDVRGIAGLHLGAPLHAPLRRLRGLAEQQRGDRRIAIAGDDLIDELLTGSCGLGQQFDRLVAAAEFDERDRRVHTVAVLVRLGAKGLAEGAHRLVRRDRIAHRARRKVSRDTTRHPPGDPGGGRHRSLRGRGRSRGRRGAAARPDPTGFRRSPRPRRVATTSPSCMIGTTLRTEGPRVPVNSSVTVPPATAGAIVPRYGFRRSARGRRG